MIQSEEYQKMFSKEHCLLHKDEPNIGTRMIMVIFHQFDDSIILFSQLRSLAWFVGAKEAKVGLYPPL